LKELISQREYARRHGISHVAVQRAVNSGRISTVGGRIDPDRADREWRENTDQSKPRNRITGEPRHARAPDEPSQPMDLDGVGEDRGGAAAGYARARVAREFYMAQLAKLLLERRREKLVRADEVRLAAFQMDREVRERLRAFPARATAAIGATRDADEIRRILEEEVDRTCREIAYGERS
jgi:hypothetical protein